MTKTSTPPLPTGAPAPGRKYLVVGPYCWGQSPVSAAKAVSECKKASSPLYLGSKGFRCIVFDAHATVYLDGMGSLCYIPADIPEGEAPYTELARIGKF
jgi:hypothetical protein